MPEDPRQILPVCAQERQARDRAKAQMSMPTRRRGITYDEDHRIHRRSPTPLPLMAPGGSLPSTGEGAPRGGLLDAQERGEKGHGRDRQRLAGYVHRHTASPERGGRCQVVLL